MSTPAALSRQIILGVDPGTVLMGYAAIAVEGSSISVLCMDVLRLGRFSGDTHARLGQIHARISALIAEHRPTSFAIEAPFFGKNVQSMLKLGRAQGVAIAAAMGASIPVAEYAPRKIKQSITGNGSASKEQVLKMLCSLLSLGTITVPLDASDALAVALCHHYQGKSPVTVSRGSASRKTGSWEQFVKENAGRVR